MSIAKTTYSPTHSVNPRYLNITKDTATGIIIVDDTNGSYTVEVHTEINKQVAWLKILPGFESSILDEAPEGISEIDSFGNWDKTRLFAQSSEVFVVQFTNISKITQTDVTGYSLGVSDALFVKIDQTNNTVTLYE